MASEGEKQNPFKKQSPFKRGGDASPLKNGNRGGRLLGGVRVVFAASLEVWMKNHF